MEPHTAQTLLQEFALQPTWLQWWLNTMMAIHLAAVVFIIRKNGKQWHIQLEALAIIISFMLSSLLMSWIYQQLGYVRLLGLAHLLFWGPVFFWIYHRVKSIKQQFFYKHYLSTYLVIAGTSLIVDTVDLFRFFIEV